MKKKERAILSLKVDSCCRSMDEAISETQIVNYEPVDRTYGILWGKRRISFLSFCPWCGTKLKKRLNKEFCQALTELGIKSWDILDDSTVPKEFRSDAWWKKRGL